MDLNLGGFIRIINLQFIMKYKVNYHLVWEAFRHPRVFLFILAGALIIFLTFLTRNNALEIAISGIASVFIGIGVNNYTSHETHLLDERKQKSKSDELLRVMEITKSKIGRLTNEMEGENHSKIRQEVEELDLLINHGIQLIKEGGSLH